VRSYLLVALGLVLMLRGMSQVEISEGHSLTD